MLLHFPSSCFFLQGRGVSQGGQSHPQPEDQTDAAFQRATRTHRYLKHIIRRGLFHLTIPFAEFHVAEIEGVQVSMQGLGPLNWGVKRALRAFLRRHLRAYLEREGRELIEQELQNAAAIEEQQGFFSALV